MNSHFIQKNAAKGVLHLTRTWLIFAVIRREVIVFYLTSLSVWGEKTLFWGEGGPSGQENMVEEAIWELVTVAGFPC